MTPAAPRLSLILLLLAAAAVLLGGAAFSRREVTVRLERDRRPLRQFAEDLQRELHALEKAHEGHLRTLALQVTGEDRIGSANECDTIVGVAQCSFLYRNTGQADEHVRAPGVKMGAYPVPTFGPPSPVKPADFLQLERGQLFDQPDAAYGWIELPGRALLFWQQRSKTEMIIFTLNAGEVRAAIGKWITTWRREHRAPLGSELIAPDDPARAGGGTPDWEQPLPTRYGTWQLLSWDARETRVSHDRPTVMATATIAVFLAGLGVFVFMQQRRALRLAAQQVSFVNSVSHELRTPLTNMLLNLDVVAESLGEEQKGSVGRLALVREEAGRLGRLIENVLAFSRQEQGKLTLHPRECRPRGVVDTVLAQFEPSLARRSVVVQRDHEGLDQSIQLDSDALSQIASNLFSNLEKYAPGAAARVLTSQAVEGFTLTVSDEGPGIPADARHSIFEPFTRLNHDVTEGTSGAGLGLAISRELAGRLGGTLILAPSNRGASFVLHIPVTADSLAGQSPP